MIVSDFFDEVNDAYRGTDDDAPATGTSDFSYWLRVTNRKIREFKRDSGNMAGTNFEIRTVATITATVQDYDLDDDFLLPSDKVIVTTTDDQDVEFTLRKPTERGDVMRSVYITGIDPQVLSFYDTITSTSNIVGGALKVPGYYIPDPLTAEGDDIPLTNTEWLIYEVAAELAFNDLTYESKAADLQAKANNQLSLTKATNRRGTYGNPRTVPTNVNRIMGPRGGL